MHFPAPAHSPRFAPLTPRLHVQHFSSSFNFFNCSAKSKSSAAATPHSAWDWDSTPWTNTICVLLVSVYTKKLRKQRKCKNWRNCWSKTSSQLCRSETRWVQLQSLTLEEFLTLPETKPAEFINGEIVQKPMPQGEHSRLQGKLCAVINQVTEDQKIAFPELRCTFGGESVVPDVTVFQWNRIPRTIRQGYLTVSLFTQTGQSKSSPLNRTKLKCWATCCIALSTALNWDGCSTRQKILVVFPDQRVQLLRGTTQLPILNGIPLQLTVEQVFDWLSF